MKANPNNRMAFEYLMAHYLSTRQLDKVALHMNKLGNFDYPTTPRLYEEALLLGPIVNPGSPVNLGARQISFETAQRFQAFSAATSRFGDDKRAAQQAVEREFGDTYWFYYLFGDVEAPPPPTEMKAYQ